MFSSLAMPLLLLIVFGAGFNRIIGEMAVGVNFIQFMYPGLIAMTTLMMSVMSGLSVVWDREFGFLKEVLVAPLNRSGIVLGKAVGGGTVAVGQGMIMLLIAPLLGVQLTPLLVLQLIPLLIILSLSLSGLGILVASRMRSQWGFQLVIQIMIMPMIFMSGVFFPVNNVAPWLGVVSKLNPLTYGVDAIRQLFLGGDFVAPSGLMGDAEYTLGVTVLGHTMTILEDILIVGVIGVVLMSIAVWSFSKME